MKKQIVIARHNTDLKWLSNINIPYIIYTHDNLPGAVYVDKNKGFDASLYLKYIIDY